MRDIKRKKLFSALTAFLFVLFSLFVIKTEVSNSAGSLDQHCMLMSDTHKDQINRPAEVAYGQGFTPTKNRLTGIKLFFTGDGKGQVYLDLYRSSTFITSSSTVGEPTGWGVSTFTFPDVTMTPGDGNYRVIPRLVDNTSLFWHYKHSGGCYSGGAAYIGGLTNLQVDFSFATYGYNAAEEPESPPSSPPPASTPETNEQTSTTTDSLGNDTTGETPKEPSSDITPPENLETTSDSDSITLKWEASPTLEVDGYRIYRSEKESEDFTSLGEVAGSTLEFTDSSVDKNKTYYYFVRATIGTEKESDSSNTVEAKTEEVETTTATESDDSLWTIFLSLPLWQQALFVGGVLLILILLGYLIYRGIKDHNMNKKIKEEN